MQAIALGKIMVACFVGYDMRQNNNLKGITLVRCIKLWKKNCYVDHFQISCVDNNFDDNRGISMKFRTSLTTR